METVESIAACSTEHTVHAKAWNYKDYVDHHRLVLNVQHSSWCIWELPEVDFHENRLNMQVGGIMRDRLEALQNSGLAEIQKTEDLKQLDDLRIKYLGKKGEITELMKGMKDLSNEERPLIGKLVNDVKEKISEEIDLKFNFLNEIQRKHQLETETIDIRNNLTQTHRLN